MSIVFDEVIANIEAPVATVQTGETKGANVLPEQDDKRIIRIIETQKRWAKRLMAD